MSECEQCKESSAAWKAAMRTIMRAIETENGAESRQVLVDHMNAAIVT